MTQLRDYKGIREFQHEIIQWWAKNARELPWRKKPSPYHVLVSEVMLQQTQVNRVIPKYQQFLHEFPNIKSLANAETKHLLSVWSGLGYNRRALWLKEAAKQIFRRGEFPQTIRELQSLKGIGPYTSRSILIFAFNKDLAAVDTNIRRVLIARGFADREATQKELQEIAEKLLLRGRSRDWHNALMDYGALVLTSEATRIASEPKQSKFKGSTRQIRGSIVRMLTQVPSLTFDEIRDRLQELEASANKIQLALKQLTNEHLIELTEEGSYLIPS